MNNFKHNYIGFQRNKCLCYFINDIEIEECDNTNVTVCGDNQNLVCGDRDNVTVIYEMKSQVINSLNNIGECGVVKIDHNQTTFRSIECSKNAAILCFDDGTSTLHAYPNKTNKWEKAVQFCLKHDRLISSVQNVMHESLPNATEGTYWVSAVRGISFKSLNDDSVECQVVNIANNKTTFRSMPCSNKESILCFDNGTFTAYPTQKENFNKSVKFCQEQDRLVSSVEDLLNGNLLNVTDGSYWVFTTSRIAVQATIDNDFCVASLIENGKKMTPIVKSCDVKLPVTCRIGSFDPWNGTSRECVTSGHDITSTNSYITTNMANVSVQTQSLMERNLVIIIISGSIGFIVLVVIVIILICKRRKRTMKTENVKSNSQETKVKLDYAEVLPDVEYKNNSDTINIYDHTDTSQAASKLDTNLQSEYDSMAGIKQEAEGLYDESATCPSGHTQTKELEDGLYDHC
ncbi:Hypothetical predicted protein [Mytilus galloprovincialis]|nr:Hypothetical predicted protein [Mytilus galloprovincialis]